MTCLDMARGNVDAINITCHQRLNLLHPYHLYSYSNGSSRRGHFHVEVKSVSSEKLTPLVFFLAATDSLTHIINIPSQKTCPMVSPHTFILTHATVTPVGGETLRPFFRMPGFRVMAHKCQQFQTSTPLGKQFGNQKTGTENENDFETGETRKEGFGWVEEMGRRRLGMQMGEKGNREGMGREREQWLGNRSFRVCVFLRCFQIFQGFWSGTVCLVWNLNLGMSSGLSEVDEKNQISHRVCFYRYCQ